MPRYVGIHTMPGFTKEMLAGATPQLEELIRPHFLRACTSFSEGKVVCEWEADEKASVGKAYAELGFPYDEIVLVEAICDNGDAGVSTRLM